MERMVFGPVPSRRLGKSLGVNNIPHKVCSYSCMYCQVGNAFSSTGNFREDILSITAVHPMREDAILKLLHKTDDNKNILALLIEEKLLEKLQYGGHTYYLRKFSK